MSDEWRGLDETGDVICTVAVSCVPPLARAMFAVRRGDGTGPARRGRRVSGGGRPVFLGLGSVAGRQFRRWLDGRTVSTSSPNVRRQQGRVGLERSLR